MRVPKALNPRIQKQLLKQFGIYQKVLPVQTTPTRAVPDHIEKPDYILGRQVLFPDKPEIKNETQLKGMKRSCELAYSILQQVQSFVKPGVTTDEIDELVHNLAITSDAYPSPLLYKGFPKSVCTSVNNVAVHGIPDLRSLEDGDIVNVDITVFYKGFHGDCSKTFLVGEVDDRGVQLVGVTEECLDIGIRTCGPGVPFCEIGLKIQNHAERNGLTVIPSVLGHGIGKYFHGPPDIFHAICIMSSDIPIHVFSRTLPAELDAAICLSKLDDLSQVYIFRHNFENRGLLEQGAHILPKSIIMQLMPVFLRGNDYRGVMKPGMTFTIEPAVTHGSEETVLLEDGWTLITEDGARASQIEHTVLITEDGAEILTK